MGGLDRRRRSARAEAEAVTQETMAPAPLLVHVRLPRTNATRNAAQMTTNDRVILTHKRRSRSFDASSSDDTEDSTGTRSSREHSTTQVAPENPAPTTTKARRPAYSTLKKQERDELVKELQALEAHADVLRARVGMVPVSAGATIQKTDQENRVLRDSRRAQLLSLCGMRSLISKQLRSQFCAPLNTSIRLGTDPLQRRAALLSLRRTKLDIAYRFLEERFRGIDSERHHSEHERWTSSDGDFYASSSDLVLFRGVQSVKQVYEALQFYMINMEVSISEILGQLTLREDIDHIDTSVSNHRLLSSTNRGIVIELNVASFGEYHERYADHNNEEFALFTADFVEHDELYPYRPHEHVRKNITGAVSLRPLPTKPNEELVVALRRFGYLSIQKPQFPVSDAALEELEQNVGAWGDVMFKSIRDTLAASNKR